MKKNQKIQPKEMDVVNQDATVNLSKSQKIGRVAKKLSKRWFIDAFTGMAQGLFVTLIAGTIIKQVGSLCGDNWFGNLLEQVGIIAQYLMGAGIGAGIASHLKAPKMVIFATMVAGTIGAFSEPILTLTFKGFSIGNPIGSYICALMACEIGTLICGKTKLDILLVPLTVIVVAIGGAYVAKPFIMLVNLIAEGIDIATGLQPFVMGIIIAVTMGILLTMPTSSAAIWVAIASGVTTDSMMIASGAAVVGCAAQMVGFAVSSFRENRWSGLISQGIGTSMLQIPNIMKHPRIFIPPIIASAVVGPLATTVFKLRCTFAGGGMGTAGLVGIFTTVEASMGIIPTWQLVLGIVLLFFVIPAVVSLAVSELMRKLKWIKKGDMQLNYDN